MFDDDIEFSNQQPGWWIYEVIDSIDEEDEITTQVDFEFDEHLDLGPPPLASIPTHSPTLKMTNYLDDKVLYDKDWLLMYLFFWIFNSLENAKNI